MGRTRYLVAYDIREDRRLREVHATVRQFGYALQYSVFICDLDFREKLLMKEAVGRIIDHGVDSVVWVDLGDAATRGTECFDFMGDPAGGLPESGHTFV